MKKKIDSNCRSKVKNDVKNVTFAIIINKCN